MIGTNNAEAGLLRMFALRYIPQNLVIDGNGLIIEKNVNITQLKMILEKYRLAKVSNQDFSKFAAIEKDNSLKRNIRDRSKVKPAMLLISNPPLIQARVSAPAKSAVAVVPADR